MTEIPLAPVCYHREKKSSTRLKISDIIWHKADGMKNEKGFQMESGYIAQNSRPKWCAMHTLQDFGAGKDIG